MVQKLKLVLKDRRLTLGLRALVFALSFVFLPAWVTLAVATLLYFFPAVSFKAYAGIFSVFVWLGFVFSGVLPDWAFIAVFSVLAALIFGVKNRVFEAKSLPLLGFSSALLLFLSYGYVYGKLALPLFAFLLIFVFIGTFSRFISEDRRNIIAPISLSLTLGLSEIAWLFSLSGLSRGYIISLFSLLLLSGFAACLLEARFGRIAPRYALTISSIIVIVSSLILILMAY